MKEGFKRWAPLVGGFFLAAVVVLRLTGNAELADTLQGLAGATGMSEQSPVGLTELTAAGTLLFGISLKVRSQWKKARSLKP